MASCRPFWRGRVAAPASYQPAIRYVPGNAVTTIIGTPFGVILHGTRSGLHQVAHDEFLTTVRYVERGAGGLGWHVTVGPDEIAVHMTPEEWGWNAREHSSRYLAIEFAQAQPDDPISDAQVRAACWWLREVALPSWPDMPLHFPTHSELAAGIRDGNTDAFPKGDARADELRARVLAGLGGG